MVYAVSWLPNFGMRFLRAGPALEGDADALARALFLVTAPIGTETAYLGAS
jgi:hypothetical protein